ncbi:MAG: hypothetical protein EYC70_16685 [Planctomycetota bacterium]|nr:MAG: hypothetical protein EYC70_16685 [Planctomycetota bacterium]
MKNGSARRKGPWSHAEIERLKRSYGMRSDAQLARDLRRTLESVRRMARRVFHGEPRSGSWTHKEIRDLKNYLGAAPIETIALILRRAQGDVLRKVAELRSQHIAGAWSASELQTLKRLYGTRADADLALILSRGEEEIHAKARELCLAKDKAFTHRYQTARRTRMPRWTVEEVQRLSALYPVRSNLDIARELRRSVKSVVSKAHDLGLHKNDERLREMGRENVRQRYAGARGAVATVPR